MKFAILNVKWVQIPWEWACTALSGESLKDVGAAVCRGHQSVIPLCSPAAQGLKKLKKIILRKGLWRPGGNAGVSKVWNFAEELCSSCSEYRALAVCSMSPGHG